MERVDDPFLSQTKKKETDMRIFNGKDAQISLPLGTVRLEIPSKVASKDFAPNPNFLSLIVTSYTEKDLALIVSGPFELSMCSTIPAVAPLMVQSLEEAIERFMPKQEEPKEVEQPKEEVVEAPIPEAVEETLVDEVKEEAPVEEATIPERPKKKNKKNK